MVVSLHFPSAEGNSSREPAEFGPPACTMDEVCRHLYFSSLQRENGITAQLQALGLDVLSTSGSTASTGCYRVWHGVRGACKALQAEANSSREAIDARLARKAAVGAAGGPVVQWHGLDALSKDPRFAQLVDQGKKAKQQLAQMSALLQAKVAQQTAKQAQPQQQPRRKSQQAATAEDPLSAAQATGRRREITVPLRPQQDRKRDCDGGFKQSAAPGSSHNAAADNDNAAARWANNHSFTSASKRHAAGANHRAGIHQQQHDPIGVDDDSDSQQNEFAQPGPNSSRAAAASFQQGRHCSSLTGGGAGVDDPAAGAGRPGFMSARTQLVTDLRRKGQHQQANRLQQTAPRAASGLTRPRGGGAGAAVSRSGFVPPFVDKALNHQQNNSNANGGGGGGGGKAGGGGDGGEEGPLSARTLEMLGIGPEEELPPELAKLDPKLIEQVCNEVIDSSGSISWDDIAGLQTAKNLVQEIVVWPMMNPELFTGPRAPPKGILLFGPPGTGKTLIGKAIASNIKASFFSISASSLTSKWIGEGEKMVKVLFAVAGVMQPSVIFIDEIDSLLSARKSDGEHEASRRLKTQLLVEMEGCDPTSSARRVLLVGATNRPEELDEAARRRMPKQLYIPLPCAEARRQMILRQLGPGAKVSADLSPPDVEKIVSNTDGYSGSDMRNLIQEACQGPIRAAAARLKDKLATLRNEDLRPVRIKDFAHASKVQRASVTAAEIERYEEYNERHGAKIVEHQQDGDDEDSDEDPDW